MLSSLLLSVKFCDLAHRCSVSCPNLEQHPAEQPTSTDPPPLPAEPPPCILPATITLHVHWAAAAPTSRWGVHHGQPATWIHAAPGSVTACRDQRSSGMWRYTGVPHELSPCTAPLHGHGELTCPGLSVAICAALTFRILQRGRHRRHTLQAAGAPRLCRCAPCRCVPCRCTPCRCAPCSPSPLRVLVAPSM